MNKIISELIDQAFILHGKTTSAGVAYYLISNGIIKLPCEIGATLYVAKEGRVLRAKVLAFYIDGTGGMFDLDIYSNEETVAGNRHFICKDYSFEDVGKTVFLTRAEAEAALKGEGKDVQTVT